MKRLLALLFIVMMAGCGSSPFDQVFTLDESPQSAKPFGNFGGTVVWEFGKEAKPWGLVDGKLIRLNWENKATDIVFEPPRTLTINKKVICSNLVKETYVANKNQALYLAFDSKDTWLLFFDGKASKRILAQPVNGAVVSALDPQKPACCLQWDGWNQKFIFVAALGKDTSLQIYSCSTEGQVERFGNVQTYPFLPTPVDGFIIEKTSDPQTIGDLVDMTGRKMILRNCFLRNILGTKEAYFVSERKLYTFDGTNLTEIGKIPVNGMPKWFGVVEGKPFILSNVEGFKFKMFFFEQ